LNSWNLKSLDLKPRLPEILSSSEAARAIVLDLEAGEKLSEHEVHELCAIRVGAHAAEAPRTQTASTREIGLREDIPLQMRTDTLDGTLFRR
jgi:hypothetical protein